MNCQRSAWELSRRQQHSRLNSAWLDTKRNSCTAHPRLDTFRQIDPHSKQKRISPQQLRNKGKSTEFNTRTAPHPASNLRTLEAQNPHGTAESRQKGKAGHRENCNLHATCTNLRNTSTGRSNMEHGRHYMEKPCVVSLMQWLESATKSTANNLTCASTINLTSMPDCCRCSLQGGLKQCNKA